MDFGAFVPNKSTGRSDDFNRFVLAAKSRVR
jgi:hypothetical protein